MSTPVVLITGALTGIGRAAALAFAKGGSRVVISGRHEAPDKPWLRSCARSARRPSLSLLTYATKTLCGSWSIKRSLASVGSM